MEIIYIIGKKLIFNQMRKNKDLQAFYDDVYHKGETHYFSKFLEGNNRSETDEIVIKNLGNVSRKTILDVGCGTGALVRKISDLSPLWVKGIDYSETAIKQANASNFNELASFEVFDFDSWTKKVDVIISCGTFEHMDMPSEMMVKMASLLNPGGKLVLTCPHFYNIRGIIWITLQKLLNVPMSLTDVHSISPSDMALWSKNAGLVLSQFESFDYGRGNGKWLIEDMKKRLTNALGDAKLPNSNVDQLLSWIEDLIDYNEKTNAGLKFEGATCLYLFEKYGN
jgi:2-polyprenyl-3-methyl-5-hydroxy-6-metoxy-1,4-benzoquinol methylase